jgi:carboxymethylenebutenolidase
MRARPTALLLPLLLLALVPSAARAADPPPLDVTADSQDYPGSEGDMPAKLYAPRGTARYPGVLVLHTIAGPGPNVEAFARRLAGHGFVVMTPDVFALHEFGPQGRTDHPLVLGDLEGAIRFLRTHPRVDPGRLGAVGFSFGGRLAVIAAARHPEIRAVVVYYAVADHARLRRDLPAGARAARPLTDLAPTVGASVLIHHGEADLQVPPSQGRRLHEALGAAGKRSTLHLYPGADHLFNFAIQTDGDSTYVAAADRLSWERTLAFLRAELRP